MSVSAFKKAVVITAPLLLTTACVTTQGAPTCGADGFSSEV
jgi:hypothetical protein